MRGRERECLKEEEGGREGRREGGRKEGICRKKIQQKISHLLLMNIQKQEPNNNKSTERKDVSATEKMCWAN